MECNAISPDIKSLILMATLQNPALSQKVLKDLFRLPERQELFPGLHPCGIPPIMTQILNENQSFL